MNSKRISLPKLCMLAGLNLINYTIKTPKNLPTLPAFIFVQQQRRVVLKLAGAVRGAWSGPLNINCKHFMLHTCTLPELLMTCSVGAGPSQAHRDTQTAAAA